MRKNNVKKYFLMSATAVGLVLACEAGTANAAINVTTGNEDISSDVLNLIKTDVNREAVAEPDKSQYTYDKAGDGVSEKVSIFDASGNAITEVSDSDYTYTSHAGDWTSTAKEAAEANVGTEVDKSSYSFTGNDASKTSYKAGTESVDATKYSYAKISSDGKSTETVNLLASGNTENLSTDTYSYSTTKDYRADGKESVSVDTGVEYSDYQFTDKDGTSYSLGDYVNDTGDLTLPSSILSDSTAASNAGSALTAYNTDLIAYEAVKDNYNKSNEAYKAALAQVTADQEVLTAMNNAYIADLTAYTAAAAKKKAAQESLTAANEAYNTASEKYQSYNGSLAQTVDKRAETSANNAITESVADGGIVSNAIDTAVQDEATARANADTELNNKITTETTERKAADTELDGKITAEATARADGDAKLDAKIGSLSELADSTTGNLSSDTNASVAEHFAALDTRIGKIQGLFDGEKVNSTTVKSTTASGSNLAKGTTVEDHLVSLDNAIGDRTNIGSKNAAINTATKESVASGLKAAGDVIGDADFSSTTYASSATDVSSAIRDLDKSIAASQVQYENRFNSIDRRIHSLKKEMNRGLAANAALAGLTPLSDSKYKTQLSVAFGGYRDNQAIALGGYHYFSDNILMNAGVAYGGKDSTSYNVGVTFGF